MRSKEISKYLCSHQVAGGEWAEMKLRSLQILIENTHFKTHFKTYFPPRNAKSDKLQACAFGSNAAREIAAAQRNYITAIISFIITICR